MGYFRISFLRAEAPANNVIIAKSLDAALSAFAAGKRVFWMAAGTVADDPQRPLVAGFSPVFWNTAWTQWQPPHTLGILCDPGHPALALFPTEFHSNWQWWEIQKDARPFILTKYHNLKPVVQVIDDWVTNRKLGYVFETKVGSGKLLACSADLEADLPNRPAARQFRRQSLALSFLAVVQTVRCHDACGALRIGESSGTLANPLTRLRFSDTPAYGYDALMPARRNFPARAKAIILAKSPACGGNPAMHPFLAPDFHVRWSTLTPEAVEPDIRAALETAKANIEAICQVRPDEAAFDNTFGALETACDDLNRGWGRLQHLDSVSDEPKQREALNHMLPEVSDFFASIPLNARLWASLKVFGDSPAVASLHPVHRRLVEETMADFRQAGADLPDDKKTRAAEIDAELSKLTKEYGEHVLDSTNAWELVIEDESKLAGLPESALAGAHAAAKAKGYATAEKPAWRFTLQMPSMLPVMQYLHDDDIRRQVWEASTRVASQGEHDNTALVWRILELRQEKADILGRAHFADLTLMRRMAKDGRSALGFVEDLHRRVLPAYLAEYRQLRAFKAAKCGAPEDDLQPWEVGYWAERQRKECYDLDDEELRPYFPGDGVMAGMFELASRLFGISIRQRETVYREQGAAPAGGDEAGIEVWHPEVTFYDLHDLANGEHFGSFYADWHPRESKRGGAWMNCLDTGAPGTDGTRAALISD